nr:AAA family ATPase [Candidatus Promineifilum breve]
MVAFALGVDWDELKGTTKSLKTVALIQYADRRGEMSGLLALLSEERPALVFPTIPPAPAASLIDEEPDRQLTSIQVQSQSGGVVNVGNIITGHVDGDIVQGDKVSGGIVITGSVTGDVHINYTIRPDVPRPPPPAAIPEIPLFVGRESELTYFQTMLDRSGLAVISGMAGMGKTTLAAVMARRLAAPERTFWHVFHEGEGVESVIWRLAGFLAFRGQDELWRLLQNARLTNGRPPPPESLFDYLTQLLRGRDYLLCFDDFQHVDEDPLLHQLVEQLRILLGGGELRMIITTRRIPEFVQRVVAFEPLGGMSLADTRQLLEGQEVYLSSDRLEQLYHYTGGNAQLLSLAVDVLRDAGDAASLLDRLIDADNIERYLLDEVDGRLTRDERQVMSAVAVLQGYPAGRNALEAVLDGRSARRVLRDLADRSLLTVSRVDEERLYSQHAIVRDFYYSSLGRAQRQEMHRRAGHFYRGEGLDSLLAARHYYLGGAFVEAADLATTDVRAMINRGQTQQLGRLLAGFEHSQLDAMRWAAVKNAEGQIFLYLGESQPARDAFQAALATLESLPAADESGRAAARACLGMGELLTQQAPEEALGWLERGLALVAGLDSETEAALTLQMGELFMFTGRFDEAQEMLARGLAALPSGPGQWRASALENLGAVAVMARGDVAAAYALAEQALMVSEELEDSFRIARLKSMMGGLSQMSDDWPAARRFLEEAVAIAERLGNRKILAQAAMNEGVLLVYLGDYDAARQRLSAALVAARQTGQLYGVVLALLSLADVAVLAADWNEVTTLINEAQQLSEELQLHFQLPRIRQLQATVALGRGDGEAALARVDESIAAADANGDQPAVGVSERMRGQALAYLGRGPEAEVAFRRSAEILEPLDRFETARTRAAWGATLARQGGQGEGVRLIAQARATFEALGARGELARLPDP